ncbi:hypothetical protein [Janthinobacterium fluminis]|uniref:Lipoprotein n=1 Tax=Janthinobacterium fluminis TaxID=2987524 RepID=A0ABT5K6C2_9BURK|nr:hypothetical protein [Janthinobacterium fluminis]MDC8760550.1 hypothetical protein [Janthinobacterium fluminis]
MARKWISAVILGLVSASCLAGDGARSALFGRWVVTGTADAQETTSLSSDDADKLTGTDFIVTAESVRFSDEICDKPKFKQASYGTAVFFRREYKLDPRKLRLPDPVTEITIDCLAPSPISFVYIKDKRHIVFFWKGFFLNAKIGRAGFEPATDGLKAR